MNVSGDRGKNEEEKKGKSDKIVLLQSSQVSGVVVGLKLKLKNKNIFLSTGLVKDKSRTLSCLPDIPSTSTRPLIVQVCHIQFVYES